MFGELNPRARSTAIEFAHITGATSTALPSGTGPWNINLNGVGSMDDGKMMKTGSGIIVSKAGIYSASATIDWDAAGNKYDMYPALIVAGEIFYSPASSGTSRASVSMIVRVNVGDTINLALFNGSGSAFSTTSGSAGWCTYMMVCGPIGGGAL